MKAVNSYRKLVVGVDNKVPLSNGMWVKGINFDNAATTPPFYGVLEDILKFCPWYSSIHRGTGFKSTMSSEIYETSREIVCNFVGADKNSNAVIYVKNTTESINKLSNILCDGNKENVVLSTSMEHHSNDLPWRKNFTVDYVDIDDFGRLSLEDLENKLLKYKGKVKLVTVTGASNVTGYINSIYEIAEIVHNHNCKLMVDGAQLVPHCLVDMKPSSEKRHIDYLVFSSHKMYAPFGIGVLIGPKDTFSKASLDYVGGGTIKFVSRDTIVWDDPPQNQEAGSPNVIGVVALLSAISTINKIGIQNIENHEKNLLRYAEKNMKNIPQIKLYSLSCNECNKVGIIPFNISGMNHHTTAELLSKYGGIAVRDGCFCAQPYIQKLLKIPKEEIIEHSKNPNNPHPGMVRISFGLYNTFEEIDALIDTLKFIVRNYCN